MSERIREIRKRLEAQDANRRKPGHENSPCCYWTDNGEGEAADAQFIRHAPDDIAYLLGLVAAPEPTAEPEGEAMKPSMKAIRADLIASADHPELGSLLREAVGVIDALATRPPTEALREAREMIREGAQDVSGPQSLADWREKADRWLARTDATEPEVDPTGAEVDDG